MEVSSASLIAAQKSFRAIFLSTYDSVAPMWPKIAMLVNSTTLMENLNFFGRVPMLREWLGSKQVTELSGFDLPVANKDFEATIAVDRNDIEDDRLGLYTPVIQQLGGRARRHPDKLLSALRVAGVSTKGFDGKNFYATDHKWGKSAAMSNKLTGTGTTLAQITADFNSALAALRGFVDDQGEPFLDNMGAKLELLVTCAPALEGQFRDLSAAKVIANTENTLFGQFEYMIDARLSGNDWYLDYVGDPIKPFIYQQRKAPTVVIQDDPSSDTVFHKKKFHYGVESRGNVAPGMWAYSVMIDN